MTDLYPGYDVMDKQDTPSWDAITREVIAKRLSVPTQPRYFDMAEWQTLGALCDRILPQPTSRPKVLLPAYVDAKIFEKHLDGYRYATLPAQGEAWKRGLAALDHDAQVGHGARFHDLAPDQQDALIKQMQDGALVSAAWSGMPCKDFFEHRVIADITHAYYAHPTAWNELGFGGPASPRGYVRMQLDRRDPWEAAEAKPGHEHQALQENTRGL